MLFNLFKKNYFFNILTQLKHKSQNLVQLKKFNTLLQRINRVDLNVSTTNDKFLHLYNKRRKLGARPSIMVLGHQA